MSKWKANTTPLYQNGEAINEHGREINGIFLLDNFLYFTDHHTLKRLDVTTGECNLIAGRADESGDKLGVGTEARFNVPWGVAVDRAHKNAYVADWDNHKIKRVDLETKEVFTLAGSTGGFVDGEDGESTKLSTLSRLVLDESTNLLYILEFGNASVRVVSTENGKTSTLCRFHPESSYLTIHKGFLWISKRGTVVKVDMKTGEHVVHRITNCKDIRGIVFDRAGTLYIADNTLKTIFSIHISSKVWDYEAIPLLPPEIPFKGVAGLAMDRKGNLIVCEQSAVYFVRRPLAIPWELERVLWISKLKNHPESCVLASLPKEIIREIIAIGNSL